MKVSRFALAGLAALGLACGGELATATQGLAEFGYPATPNAVFGTAGSGDGQLAEPIGIAVNDASGDVYVADSANDRVQEFDASGKYLAQWDGSETPAGSFSDPRYVAVDNASDAAKEDVYVVDVADNVVDIFTKSGKYLSQLTGYEGTSFSALLGVAIGAAGEIWVYQTSGQVYEFTDSGSPHAIFNTGRGTEAGLAVDSAGSVYVLFGCNCVGKYHLTSSSSAEQLAEWGSGGTALAINSANNNVLVDELNQIQEFGPFGEPYGAVVSTFAVGGISESHGIAVNDANGTLYATQRVAGSVALFNSVLLANATTGAASGVGKTAATIAGTIGREGLPTKYHFQYGATTAYGSSTTITNVLGEEEAFSASLSGLTPGTTYHYRIVAENANGASAGADRTFTTPPAVDSVQTEAAESVGKTSATLNGALAPDGADTHYYFEYGVEWSFGSTTPAPPGADAGSASSLEHVQTALTGLSPNTTYQYRIVASNALGTTRGEVATFTTLPAVDSVQTEAASSISAAASTLNGALAPDGLDARYYFEYGEEQSYGVKVPAPPGADAGSASSVEHVQAALTGLLPHTTYHYRIVASNSLGTTDGEDMTFTTSAVPATVNDQPPTVSNIMRTSAVVNSTVNTENSPTTLHAEYVAADAYAPGAGNPYAEGASSPSYEVHAARGDQAAIPLPLAGLLPGTTYHYRLVASDAAGTVYGPDYTFAAAAAAPPGVQADPASAVTQTTATLSGLVEAQALQTSYEFQVGTDASYGGAQLFGNAGQSAAPDAVSVDLQFLVPGTVYHYRLVATNVDGTTYGPDMEFSTAPVSTPLTQPLTSQLITSPTVQFPSVAGAITKPQATKKSKAKGKAKRRARKRSKRKSSSRKHSRKGGKKRS
jgi:phosphodiesterase/alkaline phosphatase D-like protein